MDSSVIVLRDFGGKFNIEVGDNIGIMRTEIAYGQECNCTAGFWREG
jgi:hypothetical protein